MLDMYTEASGAAFAMNFDCSAGHARGLGKYRNILHAARANWRANYKMRPAEWWALGAFWGRC